MEWYSWALFAPAIFWCCERLERAERNVWWFFWQALSGIFFACLHVLVLIVGARIEAILLETGNGWITLGRVVVRNHFHSDIFTYAALVSVWHAIDYYRKLKRREIEARELSHRLSQAQLQTLKAQLQPHFLFNTLNGIAELNYQDPRAANKMISKLSELLRLSLATGAEQEIPLEQELQFNRHYLELEQIRLGERLQVELDIAPETLEAQVPALLLQPLVENAIRHGIAPFIKAGAIRIETRREGTQLRLEVKDSGPGLNGAKQQKAGGVGLSNTRARLQELYGNRQELMIESGQSGGLTVSILIPFRSLADARGYQHIDEYSHVNS
jgi:two-component system LytT family sensor kinase